MARNEQRNRLERRRRWDQQWRSTSAFDWSLPGVAPQLETLAGTGDLNGPALDLGCGSGAATAYLAAHTSPSIGVDFAFGAVRQAAELATASPGSPPAWFAVADALDLPFPPASFGFVFDRGCLQNVPRPEWARYFDGVSQVLRPGGVLQLLVSKLELERTSPLSLRGLRQRMSRYVRGSEADDGSLTPLLREVRPEGLLIETIEDFPFTTTAGRSRLFTHAVYRKLG